MFDLRYKAEDVGTRLQHLFELQDLWGWALQIRTNSTWHTDLEKEQAEKLESAMEMLNHVLVQYQGPTDVAHVINSLPKDAKDIPNDTIVFNENKIT